MLIKYLKDKRKYFSLIISSLVLISFSQLISGCGGSDEVEVTQRDKDSIATYITLQKSFSLYSTALKYNQSADQKKAQESFESSLKYLNEINYEMISMGENYFWKQDYNELAKSIVEDYLITQPEVSQNSLVFEFASRVPVTYEKVEEITKEAGMEPMPGGNDVPFVMNSAVEQYIEFFSNTERGRAFVDKCLYRSGKYFPLMRKILKENNAPEELIYLSVQESGLNPTIVSRAGAVGLWQFMPATGNSYGLYQDGYRDDRRDFEKATDAAAHLLKDLYRSFDDWYLAFCGYNAGPGRVNSAIRKSGSRDFWSLRGFLPGETKNYVPSIIALSYVFRDPAAYGFKDVEYGTPISYDRVNIASNITLQEVASFCDTDIETIRDLNPEIMNDEIPLYETEYQLRIPQNTYELFASNFARSNSVDKSSNFKPEFAGTEITGYTSSTGITYYKINDYSPEDVNSIGSTAGKKKVAHECNRKQQLAAIATYFSVRPTDIRLWNNLSYGSILQNKQKLDIYLSEDNFKKLYGKKMPDGELNEITLTESNTSKDVTVNKEEKEKDKVKEVSTNSPPIDYTDKSRETETYVTEPVETIKETPEKEIETEEDRSMKSFSESNSGTNTTSSNYGSTETQTGSEQVTESESESEEYEYVYVEESQTTVNEVKESKNNSNTSGETFHTVSKGDNLSAIAGKYNINVSDLIDWNDLKSDNIIVGQKLKVKNTGSVTSVHTVKSGENLSMIANEYGMTLSQIKEANNLKDDKILVGQKLKVSGTANNTSSNSSSKNNSVKKSYTVKKGETLASIAGKNNLSVSDLKKWNKLKSDKVLVGQVLKLYK